jgi:hypothetical protein
LPVINANGRQVGEIEGGLMGHKQPLKKFLVVLWLGSLVVFGGIFPSVVVSEAKKGMGLDSRFTHIQRPPPP